MSSFRLISTDAAARGIDVTGVKCVVNYDAPQYIRTYIHRWAQIELNAVCSHKQSRSKGSLLVCIQYHKKHTKLRKHWTINIKYRSTEQPSSRSRRMCECAASDENDLQVQRRPFVSFSWFLNAGKPATNRLLMTFTVSADPALYIFFLPPLVHDVIQGPCHFGGALKKFNTNWHSWKLIPPDCID